MISTRCAVPILRILFCSSSKSWISFASTRPTLVVRGKSAAWFRSPFILKPCTTSALIFLSRKTMPMPPRPACFSRAAPRLGSNHEKFRQPMRLWSAPLPADTTDTLTKSFSSSAYWCMNTSAATWLSGFSSGASSILITPFGPSMSTTTSFTALPWISRAS